MDLRLTGQAGVVIVSGWLLRIENRLNKILDSTRLYSTVCSTFLWPPRRLNNVANGASLGCKGDVLIYGHQKRDCRLTISASSVRFCHQSLLNLAENHPVFFALLETLFLPACLPHGAEWGKPQMIHDRIHMTAIGLNNWGGRPYIYSPFQELVLQLRSLSYIKALLYYLRKWIAFWFFHNCWGE